MDQAQAKTQSTKATSRPGESLRLDSLDAFRGLVILTMTFVNYLAGIADIPAWAKHMREGSDGFTFVDVVFPGFLFIVGVAIPFALHKRMQRGDNVFGLISRIVCRSAALIFVGVITVNKNTYLAEEAGMSRELWFFSALMCVLVLWSSGRTGASDIEKNVHVGLRIAAGIVLAYLLFIARAKTGAGGVGWLQTQWWGILGLIGWAYLVSSVAYLLCRGSSLAMMGVLGAMILLYTGNRHGALNWLGPVHQWINPGAVFGTTAADVVIGVLVGSCFVGPDARSTDRQRIKFMLWFAAGLIGVGYLIRPLHGIDKNAATEAYALITGGICCFMFVLVYWTMDVLGKRGWARVMISVGKNALLAYLMPGILLNLFTLLGITRFFYQYGSGLPGAINMAALTAIVMLLTFVVTRAGILVRL